MCSCGSMNVVASWFCCGNAWGPCAAAGTGSCGTCQSSNYQCAWPNISDACWNQTRPDLCSRNPVRLSCGTVITVGDMCSTTCIQVTIADCGPNTQKFCGTMGTCSAFNWGFERLIDLTPAAFSAIASLDKGLYPVNIDKSIF